MSLLSGFYPAYHLPQYHICYYLNKTKHIKSGHFLIKDLYGPNATLAGYLWPLAIWPLPSPVAITPIRFSKDPQATTHSIIAKHPFPWFWLALLFPCLECPCLTSVQWPLHIFQDLCSKNTSAMKSSLAHQNRVNPFLSITFMSLFHYRW